MRLTDEQIQYGFYYDFTDRKNDIAEVTEVSEYAGEEELIINCTQLGTTYKSAKDKNRVLTEWCEFLVANPKAFKVLKFGTRMPQELFDAVCHQQNLRDLEIKWGVYKDLSAIQNLKNLNLLYIGSGAGVESVRPIGMLPKLVGLYVENFQKVKNYAELTKLSRLESLTICGDGMGPKYITVDSIEFLRHLPQLRFLELLTIRLRDSDYSPILNLQQLEHLSLRPHKDVKRVYDNLRRLPKLKWGLLKSEPELFTDNG
jgi:hypothetical protein